MLAASNGCFKIVKLLMEHSKVDIHSKNIYGHTALTEAANTSGIYICTNNKPCYQYKETIEYLIDNGAYVKGFLLVEGKDATDAGWEPACGGVSIIKAMITKNAKEMVWNEISQALFSTASSPFSTLDDSLGTFGCYVVQSIIEYVDFHIDKTSNLSCNEWDMLIDWTNSRKGREK
jgi:hypothetical protein